MRTLVLVLLEEALGEVDLWPALGLSSQLLLPVTQRNNFEGSLLGCIQSIEINRESFVEKLGVLSIKLLSVNV